MPLRTTDKWGEGFMVVCSLGVLPQTSHLPQKVRPAAQASLSCAGSARVATEVYGSKTAAHHPLTALVWLQARGGAPALRSGKQTL